MSTDAKDVDEVIERARRAQRQLREMDQTRIDDVVCAAAWVGMHDAERLAKLAVKETGLGNVEDKIQKNRRKTMGTLRDLRGAPSVGVVARDQEKGLVTIVKPVGVVAAMTPVTNPGATPINNIMITTKGRNAVILAPHPKADRTCGELVRLVHEQLDAMGAPRDAVQHFTLRAPSKDASKRRSEALMAAADLVLVTAGPSNVRAGYSSGTPALGVGRGNAPVIVDRTADLAAAATHIVRSATFDHATSCSSENALVVDQAIYTELVDALKARGSHLVSLDEKHRLENALWQDGGLNRALVAQSPKTIAEAADLSEQAQGAKLFLVEEERIGPAAPFSGEKLAPVVALYRFDAFDEALAIVERILDYQGKGHSVGIHSRTESHVDALAERADVCRVLVNQAHCIGNGGDFANGLDFTLSLAAGTWGGNSTSDNITYKHFLNTTRVARPIDEVVPTEEELFADYRRRRDAHEP